jgi:integrase
MSKKRSDGYYEIKVGGKSYYGKTQAAARAKAAEAQRKAEEGLLFEEVANAYEAYITGPESQIRRGTQNAYIKNLKHLHAEFDGRAMNTIDAQAVHIWMERLKSQGYSLHSITNARSVLSCVFTYWCSHLHGTGNPVDLAKLPVGLERGQRLPPSDADTKVINAHPEGCGWWAVLFKCTGIRIGEANALRWRDFRWDEGLILIDDARPWDGNQPYEEDTKSKAGHRAVPILDELRRVLYPISRQHSADDFVLSGTDKPLTQSQYSSRWTTYCRTLGLATSKKRVATIPATTLRPARTVQRTVWQPNVTAHQFRHLYATALFEAGVPEQVAQVLLGHADIITTKRVYQHVRQSMIQSSTARLNLYFNNQEIS